MTPGSFLVPGKASFQTSTWCGSPSFLVEEHWVPVGAVGGVCVCLCLGFSHQLAAGAISCA